MADEHELAVERYLRRLGGGRPDPAAVAFYASVDQVRTVDPTIADAIIAGLTETEMGVRLAKATQGIADMREIDARSPFGRVCQPADIAAAVHYLVSEQAFYITGQKIEVDGGGMAALPNK